MSRKGPAALSVVHQAMTTPDGCAMRWSLSPASVFGIAGVALEGPDSVWVVVLFDPFDYEPHLELLDGPPPAIDLDLGP